MDQTKISLRFSISARDIKTSVNGCSYDRFNSSLPYGLRIMLHVSNTAHINSSDFQKLGGGKIAYIRAMRSEDVSRLFPDAPSITPGINLFALLSADGTPLMLTDRFESARANAWENELQTLSVH